MSSYNRHKSRTGGTETRATQLLLAPAGLSVGAGDVPPEGAVDGEGAGADAVGAVLGWGSLTTGPGKTAATSSVATVVGAIDGAGELGVAADIPADGIGLVAALIPGSATEGIAPARAGAPTPSAGVWPRTSTRIPPAAATPTAVPAAGTQW